MFANGTDPVGPEQRERHPSALLARDLRKCGDSRADR
jgi:hypothetical protein